MKMLLYGTTYKTKNWVDTAIASAFSTGIISAGTMTGELLNVDNVQLSDNETKVVQAEIEKQNQRGRANIRTSFRDRKRSNKRFGRRQYSYRNYRRCGR